MTTPYRNETDALKERQAALEAEIAQLRAQTSELDGLRAREAELQRELGQIAEKLGANRRRGLPMLDQVKVASPCNASWDEMVGDEKVRFCLSCEKNVFNISAMPRAEAEQLLAERSNGELCIRYYQRADGTIMTADCPVGVKRKRRKVAALAVAGAGAMAFAAATAFKQDECHTRMGEMAVIDPPTTTATSPEPVIMGSAYIEPPAPPGKHVQGGVRGPDTKPPHVKPPPTTSAPDPKHVMGRRAPAR